MKQENATCKNKFAQLREQAKEKIKKNFIKTISVEKMSFDDLKSVIDELGVHQNELELQNQHLLETQEKLEESRRKYVELYDFAPVGYLTLAPDGKIVEANLTAAKMMNTSRKELIGSLLYLYIQREDRDFLFLHLRKLFNDFGRHTCQLRLADRESETYFQLDSVCEKDKKEKRLCRTALIDITERKKMQNALIKSEKQLKLLSQYQLETQEKERKRIAIDLHDGVAQMLAASKLYAQNLMSRIPNNSEEYQMLKNLIDINQKTLEDTKRIVDDLRPTVLDGMGIIAAIGWLCKQFGNTNPGLAIERRIAVAEEEVPENLKACIFRILQEAISNVIRHSYADNVLVSLEKFDNTLKLVVRDNGIGFENADNHANLKICKGIGTVSMTERARTTGGCLEISSSAKNGTTVTIQWPNIA